MKNLTDITIILDRSGSMQSVASDTIGGFNSFLKDQQEQPSEAVLSLVQFDNEYETVYSGKPIKDASKLTDATFQPRGMTALLDAIGRTINATGARFSELPESDRPDKVILVIMTDGFENASHEFDNIKIAEMIRTQTNDYNWDFVFVGANQDAVLSAKAIGINTANALSYAANAQGTSAVYASLSANVTSRRVGRSMGMSFSKEDREKQKKAGVRYSG